MSPRRFLVLGNLKGAAVAALEGAAKQTQGQLTHYSRVDDAIRDLDHKDWRAILVDITMPGASRFCHEARARRALFNVPLLGMTPQLSDLGFANAFRWGADDVVPLGLAAPVAARLQHLPDGAQPLLDAARGEAVVADAERARCDVLGRVLANAGYTVRYATDLVSTRYYLSKSAVKLFVVNEELASAPALIEEARAQGNTADWVVTAKQRQLETVRDSLRRFKRVAVMSAHGPPENVLFALNFLTPHQGTQNRAEPRALHSAMVLFRGKGDSEDECGCTYSISATGLYVRTLLPPPEGELWVEIEPPKAGRRVRLLGRVAWARRFGEQGAETAPAGFGVKLFAGLGNDLELWVQGFNSLEGAQPDTHAVPEVKFTPQPFRVPLPGALATPERKESLAPAVRPASRDSSPIIALSPPPPSAQKKPSALKESAPEPAGKAPPSAPVQTSISIERALLALSATPLPQRQDDPKTQPMPFAIPLPDAPKNPALAASSEPTATEILLDDSAVIQALPATATTEAASPNLALTQPLAEVRVAPDAVPQNLATTQALPSEGSAYSPVPSPVVSLGAKARSGVKLPPPAAVPASREPLAPKLEPAERNGVLEGFTHEEQGPSAERALAAGRQKKTSSIGKLLLFLMLLGTVAALLIVFEILPRMNAGKVQPETASPTDPKLSSSQGGLAEPPPAPLPGPSVVNDAQAEANGTREANALAGSTAAGNPEPPESAASAPSSAQAVASAADVPSETAPVASAPDTPSSADPIANVPEAPDLALLLEDESWLHIASRSDAEVFVHGVSLGRTNHWLRSKCGMRFVRLGAAPGQWLSEGAPHKLPCRKSALLNIEARVPDSD